MNFSFSWRKRFATIGVTTLLLTGLTALQVHAQGGAPRKKGDPPKTEPAKSEPDKKEPSKSEPAKSEPAKSDPPKSDPPKSEPAQPASSPVSPKDRDKTDPVPAKPAGAPSTSRPESRRDRPRREGDRRDGDRTIILTQPVFVPSPTNPTPSTVILTPTQTPPPPEGQRDRVSNVAGVSVMLVERIDERTLRYMVVDPGAKTMTLMLVHLGRSNGDSGTDPSWIKREVVMRYVED